MEYKRFENSSVYMLEVDTRSELNGPTSTDQLKAKCNLQNTKISRQFNRLPFIGKCSFKWFAIWALVVFTFMKSIEPHYKRYILKPFTNPDDTSIFIAPQFTYGGKTSKKTEMLIVVNSDADDQKQRDLIRKSWASSKNRKSSTKILFLIGVPKYTDLETEMAFHQDIINASIVENYYNLPLKTLVMLQFTDKFFPQIDCLIKVDSDNFLNVSNLEDLCSSLKGQELITGHCEKTSPVIRNYWSKWYVPEFVYGQEFYPLYCFGETYMFVGKQVRGKLLSKLGEFGFDTSKNRRQLPEDTIFSGFLAELADIRRQNTNGFALQKYNSKLDCLNGQARAYSFHLINEKSNFAKAISAMAKADSIPCTPSDSNN
ncbi:Hexosyltransferase [Aphelenchoides bicaudatus]|nr:Hexosyltransferase [Aphelenchoides bicaudatus]